jgi:hypothetical protein
MECMKTISIISIVLCGRGIKGYFPLTETFEGIMLGTQGRKKEVHGMVMNVMKNVTITLTGILQFGRILRYSQTILVDAHIINKSPRM